MTVEHGMRYATNHSGPFVDLVDLATRTGVTEYYVWSVAVSDFVLCSRDTVTQHEV